MYEGLICVCCMATKDLVELFGGEGTKQEDQNYAEMLQFSLNIEVKSENHKSICLSCTKQLDACVTFKNQVLNSLTILSRLEEQNSDKETEEIKYIEYLKDEFEEENLKTEFVEAETNSSEETLNKEDKRTAPSSRRRRSKKKAPIMETDHDYDTSSSFKDKAKRQRRNVMDAMPYTIDESEKVCRECGAEFPNHYTLKVHYKVHFGQFVCEVCNNRYMTAASLGKHKDIHKVGPFYCPLCGQEFLHLNSLKSHKQLKHKPLPYRCRHCSDSFATFTQRFSHEVAVHNQNEKNYKCPYCDEMFINSLLKIQHVNKVHEITIVSCKICGAKFKKSYLKIHMFKRHQIGRGWQCSLCPARRPSKGDLRRHVTTHSECPRFVCKLCNKGFAQRYALKYHIDAHIKKREYSGDPAALMICKFGTQDINMDQISRFEGIGIDIKQHIDIVPTESQDSQPSEVEDYIVCYSDQVIEEGIQFGEDMLVAQEEYIL